MYRLEEEGPEEKPQEPRKNRRERMWRALAVVLAGAVVVLLVFDTVRVNQPRMTARDVSTAVAQAMASATAPPSYANRVYQTVRPAVVVVQRFGTDKQGTAEEGQGTGVIIDQNGAILTALHVVDGANDIEVIFYDGTRTPARIVARQPQNDIAVIQPQQGPDAPLVPAVMGDPSALQVGDEVIAIGNPFSLIGSQSDGSVSGLGRTFVRPDTSRPITDMIQFDAAVNPGNSGGPLLNRDGEVVGIVTGLVNPTKENVFIGIGFAVPIQAAAGAMGSAPY